MDRRDFLSFLKHTKAIEPQSDSAILEILRLELKRARILRKYFSFQLMGSIISLFIVPQFGFGGWEKLNFISRIVIRKSDTLFTLFSSASFILPGAILAIFFLTKKEVNYLSKRTMNTLMIIIITFWFVLRVIQFILKTDSIVYGDLDQLLWMVTATLTLRFCFLIKQKLLPY